jgi:hypothetical protein
MARLLTALSRNRGSISGRGKQTFRAALGPTQPVPGCFLLASSGLGVKLIVHLHPLPSFRMSGAVPPLPHMLHDMYGEGFVVIHGI